jgi:hypothetical protein
LTFSRLRGFDWHFRRRWWIEHKPARLMAPTLAKTTQRQPIGRAVSPKIPPLKKRKNSINPGKTCKRKSHWLNQGRENAIVLGRKMLELRDESETMPPRRFRDFFV